MFVQSSAGELTSTKASVFDADPTTTGGAVNFVPSWHARAGALKFISWPSGNWMELAGVTGPPATARSKLIGGVEGFSWVPTGSKGFSKPAIIVAEWNAGTISTYEIDDQADPIVSSRRVIATGVAGAEGAFFDSKTGDFLFSTWNEGSKGENKILAIRGFASEDAVVEKQGQTVEKPCQ